MPVASHPSRRRRHSKRPASSGRAYSNPHAPLLASWLIRISLCLGWHRRPNRMQLPDILENDGFTSLTGIEPPMKADEAGDLSYDMKKIAKLTDNKLTAMFETRLLELEGQPWPAELPLIRNVDLLGNRLGLNEADKAILRLALALEAFRPFRAIFEGMMVEINHQGLIDIIVSLSGEPHVGIATALQEDGLLRASGLVRLESHMAYLESKFTLIDRLATILTTPDISEEQLVGHFLRVASPGTLPLDAFPHLTTDVTTVLPYLRNALMAGEPGINVLFYGQPGTGKTEMAKALAQELGASLYEVSFADEDGDPIKGNARLRAYNLCQRFSASIPKTLLMFDEVEDVLRPDRGGFLMSLFGGGGGSGSSGKAWINRSLERNPVPAIWITNNANIDPAYLRRFDYSIRFSIPPQSVRMAIAQRHFAEFSPNADWLAQIAANEQASPAQLERAARVARLVAPDNPAHALSISEQTLDRSATLLGQKRMPSRNRVLTRYDLGFVNVDIDLPRVIEGLRHRPRGTFCFYGPAGTGKSELGRHIADAIGKPVLLRRASDILSMWVGEAEKNIAEMFAEARQRDSVLILDEADSFLADRRDAHARWEVTQVNELLTQMEAFEGIFICTTNLMQKLDQASLRRFAFKVKFDYLNAQQREAMFLQELDRLGGNAEAVAAWLPLVARLSQLTPGDFAVAARQFDLWGTTPTAGELYEQLRKECVAKGTPMRSIGFTA